MSNILPKSSCEEKPPKDMVGTAFMLHPKCLLGVAGETNRANIFSIHEPGKLLHYAGLLLGNGYFSDIIQRTEDLRWMKRARYPCVCAH